MRLWPCRSQRLCWQGGWRPRVSTASIDMWFNEVSAFRLQLLVCLHAFEMVAKWQAWESWWLYHTLPNSSQFGFVLPTTSPSALGRKKLLELGPHLQGCWKVEAVSQDDGRLGSMAVWDWSVQHSNGGWKSPIQQKNFATSQATSVNTSRGKQQEIS